MSSNLISTPTTGEMSRLPGAQPVAPRADDLAIRVENLSKCYQIYDAPHDRLRQFVMPRLQRFFGRAVGNYHREFWALRDVSFEVAKGETVGIIGRNGAGKSTLLQLICGTLTPTAGCVETSGRVAALLELGAGFNPEFSGRENIYLNAAVLGFAREQIDERFDDIAAFADIGQFLDQPVKTYSSGMYVRLAFAVQACADPEILIVDEALSVGDLGFQYKCFRRMEELRGRGVTILMVTHSTGSVLQYANRCIVLDAGKLTHDTPNVLDAVLTYEKGMLYREPRSSSPDSVAPEKPKFTVQALAQRQSERRVAQVEEMRFGSARAIIDDIKVLRVADESSEDCRLIQSGEEIAFRVRILSSDHIPDAVLGISLSQAKGNDIWGDNNLNAGQVIDLAPGVLEVEYRVRLPISAGEYLIHCGLAKFSGDKREELDQRRPVGRLRVWSPRGQVGVVYAPVEVKLTGCPAA